MPYQSRLGLAPFDAPSIRNGYGYNINGLLEDELGYTGASTSLGDLDYTFRDSKSFGGAAARIVWTRSPGDLSNDVGDLAGRADRAIKAAMKWGQMTAASEATNLALSNWKRHEKGAAYQFESRIQNRGSQYGFNLAYGAGVVARGFQYGYSLEAKGNSTAGSWSHDTDVISILLPDLGARAMARAVRNIS